MYIYYILYTMYCILYTVYCILDHITHCIPERMDGQGQDGPGGRGSGAAHFAARNEPCVVTPS